MHEMRASPILVFPVVPRNTIEGCGMGWKIEERIDPFALFWQIDQYGLGGPFAASTTQRI